VDQVVGDGDPGECLAETVPAEGVSANDLKVWVLEHAGIVMREHAGHLLGVAPERAHVVAVGEQAGDEQRSGEAACSGDEHLHVIR
jgi:hypothetical protein